MKDSTRRRSVIARTIVLVGALFGGLMKNTTSKAAHASGAGATLRGNAPIYNPRRGKFKGYMRSETYKKNHK